MLIKGADSRQPDILALERLLDRADVPGATRKRIEAEIRQIQAGERAERDAAYQVELYFGPSENWATIHDLRIDVGGLTAQIDHLVINRLADVWVCESKSFAEGVSITEYGEWSRWRHGRQEGMPSPIEQNRRHIHLLERAFDEGLAPLPRRLGLAPMKPRIHSLVLVSDNAQIKRPRKKIDGLDQVIKAEQLKTRLFDAFDATPTRDIARVIGKEGLRQFAEGLAALHRPAAFDWAARYGLPATPLQPSAPAATTVPTSTERAPSPRPWLVKFDGPCTRCGKTLPKGTPASWDRRQRKMLCLDCAHA
jgi:Nuclease-related domain